MSHVRASSSLPSNLRVWLEELEREDQRVEGHLGGSTTKFEKQVPSSSGMKWDHRSRRPICRIGLGWIVGRITRVGTPLGIAYAEAAIICRESKMNNQIVGAI
jgi:hypothetical protein